MSEPRREYETRLARWRSRAQRLSRLDGALTWGCFAGIGGLVLVLHLVAESQVLSRGWLALPGAALALAASAGAAVSRRARRARRAIAFYGRGLVQGIYRSDVRGAVPAGYHRASCSCGCRRPSTGSRRRSPGRSCSPPQR